MISKRTKLKLQTSRSSKLVELTDTPETKKQLKTDLKMLYMGSPARLGIRTAKKEVDEHNDECGNAHTTNASDGGDVITK